MNKLSKLFLILLFLVNIADRSQATSFIKEDFLNQFRRAAEDELVLLEKQNRINDLKGKSNQNQYLVYINCATFSSASQWAGSISASLKDSELERLNSDIVKNFDNVYNKEGKKARFYVLYVDNFPVLIEKDTDIESYSDLRKKAPSHTKEIEEKATGAINSAISTIYSRVPELKEYENWVAYTIGTVVGVKNENGSDVIVAKHGFGYLASGGLSVEAKCYLNSIFSYSKISGNPFERLRIRVGDMQAGFSNILNHSPNFLEYKCGANPGKGGVGNSDALVQNYTNHPFNNKEILEDLFKGNKKITDPIAGERHTSLAKLYITDSETDENLYQRAEKDQPKGDTIKIWLHNDGSKWALKSGLTSGASQMVELYKKNNYDLKIDALIASYKDSELDKMSTALYEFFDWVSKGVEKAKIPQYVWNCDNSDEYQPVYASVYGMATVPLKPVRLLVQAQFSILLQKDPQNVFLLQNIQDAEQVEVAVLCGIWNGLVDIVAGVPKMISMLAAITSSKGWDDMEKLYVTMSDYKNPETGNVGITGALSDGVSTMFDPGKPCELAHNTSGIVVGVAICFINPTAIEGTFGQVIANVVKIVQRLDAFADALNPLSRISNFVLKSAGTAMQATLKNGKLIIKVAMRADEVFREVDWSLAKTAQMIGPDGRTYTVLMSNDPMDAARTAGRKLKEILDDEKGIPLTDANGNGLAKVEVTDGEGKITEEVAVVKLGSEISEEAVDLLTRLKNRLKNDYKWTDEEILAFEGNFKGDLELLRKFDGDQGWVEAWSIVKDGPELLRRNPENLEKLSRFMKETGMEESKLISSFGNAKDPQKWVDMKIPEADLDAAYDVMKNSPLDELTPWTKEHKAQRWANHKSGNPDADFNSWSNKYDGNIKKANAANSGVDDYYNSLGWNCSNCKEVKTSDITILTDDGLQTLSRRHDIADKSPNVKKAIEVKEYSSGKVYYSEKSIKTQVALDAELLDSKEFLSIEWVFKGCEPSKPLEDALIAAGVTIKRIP